MPRSDAPNAVAEQASRFAPLVVLHADEKLFPSAPDRFIGRSSLRWATGRTLDGDSVEGAEPQVDGGRLGAASPEPYRHGRYLTSTLTRPLDDDPARRDGPPPEQGFFLRLRRDADARGDKSAASDPSLYTGSHVHWDYDERTKGITYWLFYSGSAPPLGILRADEQLRTRAIPTEPPDPVEAAEAAAALEEFQRAYPGLAREAAPPGTRGLGDDVVQKLQLVSAGVHALLRDDDVLHEGDWERITVYLDASHPERAEPASVVYYRHSTNTSQAWASVDKDGAHPLVYCAIGSHASLPSPDFGFIDVGDRHGARWRTWEELAPIVDQPWYGFGGAWGRVGRVRDATGPLGPGAHWKRPAPRPPL